MTGASGSVSMWMAVVRVAARHSAIAARNSSIVFTRITCAPNDSAFAARSTGSLSPVSIPVAGSR